MRILFRTPEFDEFVENSNERLRNKILYVFDILETQTVINTKIIKKLTNTNLYELRIQTENEYRILTFSIDHENINQATTILLISGFMKKATKNYDKEIKKAIKILENMVYSPRAHAYTSAKENSPCTHSFSPT